MNEYMMMNVSGMSSVFSGVLIEDYVMMMNHDVVDKGNNAEETEEEMKEESNVTKEECQRKGLYPTLEFLLEIYFISHILLTHLHPLTLTPTNTHLFLSFTQ